MDGAYISKARHDRLALRMKKLGISEEDLQEKFILGSGSGGQKINKTSSCVYLRHAGTGIEVKCQRERSRALNRYHARKELCGRVEEMVLGRESERRRKQEKIRRQKRRRSRRQKEKILEQKHRQGEKKRLRGRVPSDG